ncbi:sugar ABC transporter permease [Salipiger sp. 1_MG-2023]|uniref:carbohydrate ABC transporter permease n=1 Tax=Salipiger sp. 1_MG-2023 TaxID=3062665 RepID=UPI0026E31E25|nr:sugar ABC transporter permease [Salipiger sp. 1_MG-2023]MDO6588313.1 sugar ABC transporter permease [Salipiger sp. 1_MG-2023]
MTFSSGHRKGYRLRPNMASVALWPSWLIVLAGYLVTMIWTVLISFTSSTLLPVMDFIGFAQYERLFLTPRWLQSLNNLALFGVLFIAASLFLGYLMAAALDRDVRGEAIFRSAWLYPYSLSFIVTGVVWQWIMNPQLGLQKAVNNLGWDQFRFDWIIDPDRAIYVVIIAAVWQSSGLVMALCLAGLRGVDPDLWKAIRVDGIPLWRAHLSIILPIVAPMLITAVVLLGIAVVKSYDLVVALTDGGPGTATDVPAKFIMDYLFLRGNVGLASAGATVMLLGVIAGLAPWIYSTTRKSSK